MGKNLLISPSILSADFTKLGEEIKSVQEAGADWVHVDVMDGHFVPNITIGPMIVAAAKKVATVPLDVHLMISNPDQYIDEFHAAGADVLCVHVEVSPHLHRTLSYIREKGMKAGVALNPSTHPDTIKYVLPQLDVIMLMTVNPGFGGQSFISDMLPKIAVVREMVDKSGHDILIEIDGGVSPATAPSLAKVGADVFVAGSAVFGHPPYAEVIRKLRAAGETLV
jgi:ribulose-phosphate 3-epimerase